MNNNKFNINNLVGALLRRLFFIVLVIVLVACNKESKQQQVEILRDQYGTPHVFADSNYGVYFGYGYAVATDRLFQMEMLKRTVNGRVAEVLGKDFISLDTLIRTSYDHRAVRTQLDNLPHEDKEILQAYADGFSKRVQEVLQDKQSLPKEFVDYDFAPENWDAYDVAMIFVGAIAHRYSDFNSELDNLKLLQSLTAKHDEETAWNIFNASKWLTDPESPTTVPRNNQQTKQSNVEKPDYLQLANQHLPTKRIVLNDDGAFYGTSDQPLAKQKQLQNWAEKGFTDPQFSPASNFWAVNKKLQDAKGVLVNGPQFGWGLPSYVYGIGLHGGDFNVVGNTLLGLPSLLFAHNNVVSWGSTAGLSDQVDVYIEQLNEANPEQYFHNGKYKSFESWDEVIKVRDADDVIVKARRSVHGMVVQMDMENGVAYSRARAWEGGELASLMAWVNIPKQQTLDGIKTVLSEFTCNINFYYMDVNGSLGYTHGGRYPLRTEKHDSRLPAPGTGEQDWQGFRPYSDNPTIRNPQQGYIMNWNNRPEAGWISIDLWSYTWARADRSIHIIKELESKSRLNVDDVWQINERVSYDDVSGSFLLPYLQQAWEGESKSEIVTNAMDTLTAWDQEWRVDVQGQYGAAELIIDTWMKHLFDEALKDDVGEESYAFYSATQNPNNVLGPSMFTSIGAKVLLRNMDKISNSQKPDYDFFNGQDYNRVLRNTFSSAVQLLVAEHGEDMSQWKLAAAPMQWKPYNFRGVPQASKEHVLQASAYMNRGSENNLFVVDGQNFTAYDVIPPGQSGHINADGTLSAHYDDQLNMFIDYQYKPVPFTRQQVEELTVSRKVISIME